MSLHQKVYIFKVAMTDFAALLYRFLYPRETLSSLEYERFGIVTPGLFAGILVKFRL